MSARPKLVATDLDGTLVRSDDTVSERTRAVLAAVEESGVPLVLITGRPPRWMHMIGEQTGHTGVALVANGAAEYDLHTGELLRTDPIFPDVAREVVRRVKGAVPDAVFAGETGVLFYREEAYRSQFQTPDARVVDLDEVTAKPLLKLLARTPSLDADELLAATVAVVPPELATLTHSSRDGLLEMSAAGVSKASALARVAHEQGVDAEDVVVFGDMPNDIPMLSWAGRSYAVANAHPEARAAAKHSAPSNDEDGVAQVLETWFG
ncbi:MAG TPA: HAD family hydrolase [Mycobacteriales bacterium]|nr:HAD family hydrolase [Mycobacteriales bacterium]